LQCGDGPWIGVKATIATTLHRSKVGQFIAHAKALPGNPHDGHTLAIEQAYLQMPRRGIRHARRPRHSILSKSRPAH
jgi:hypothetical protein